MQNKTQKKVNISSTLRNVWMLYKYGAFALGTLMIGWCIYALLYFGVFKEQSFDVVVPLQSGFTYHYDMQDGSKDGHHLADKNGKMVIYSDVTNFVESGNTIYGYRIDLHGNPFYFICEYGSDCSKTQNLSDVELRQIIKDRQLPLYTANSGMGRYDFEQELKRFHKTVGEGTKPQWEYDEQWQRYRISGALP